MHTIAIGKFGLFTKSFNNLTTKLHDGESSPVVGSSRINTFGLANSSRAIEIRFC